VAAAESALCFPVPSGQDDAPAHAGRSGSATGHRCTRNLGSTRQKLAPVAGARRRRFPLPHDRPKARVGALAARRGWHSDILSAQLRARAAVTRRDLRRGSMNAASASVTPTVWRSIREKNTILQPPMKRAKCNCLRHQIRSAGPGRAGRRLTCASDPFSRPKRDDRASHENRCHHRQQEHSCRVGRN
jgi:hypothetical protein